VWPLLVGQCLNGGIVLTFTSRPGDQMIRWERSCCRLEVYIISQTCIILFFLESWQKPRICRKLNVPDTPHSTAIVYSKLSVYYLLIIRLLISFLWRLPNFIAIFLSFLPLVYLWVYINFPISELTLPVQIFILVPYQYRDRRRTITNIGP
jgi:hypothetical protein